MTDELVHAERQVVERERAAFKAGCRAVADAEDQRGEGSPAWSVFPWESRAEEGYPLPTVRRLRTVEDDGDLLRYSPDRDRYEFLDFDRPGSGWQDAENQLQDGLWAAVNIFNVDAVASLKANPWEEVEG